MDSFNNDQINVEDLPKVEQLIFQPLEKRYFNVLIIGRVIFTILLSSIFAFMLTQFHEHIPTPFLYSGIGLFCLLMIWGLISTIKGFKHKHYALRKNDIVYKSGWLWKDMTTIPFNRVQHVSIDQGPIERNFTLAKLRIFTAGGSSSDMSIPGLHPETAESLKEFITKKTRLYEEE